MKKLIAVLLLLTALGFCQAKDQPAKQTNIYKVDFAVSEVQNGKRTNIRNYTMLLEGRPRLTHPHSTKVGNRVPVPVGGKDGAQFQYMDVGLELYGDIVEEREGAIVLDFNVQLASLVVPDSPVNDRAPIVRQIRQDGVAFLPIGKTTLISSMDDTNTSRTIQVEATVTLVK